jgi:GAF domain-containing protein
VAQDAPLVVPDTRKDPRFVNNPFVLATPPLRFYAGFPLHSASGETIGTLCVADHIPRTLSDADLDFMASLAATADDLIGLRTALT